MKLAPVTSANVKAIGWESGRMVVQYRDGAVYECPASEAEYRDVLAAPSKGGHLRLHFKQRLKRSYESQPDTLPDAPAVDARAGMDPRLDFSQHDPCCSPRLHRDILSQKLQKVNEWTCPKCGTHWEAKELDPVRHWKPVGMFEVFQLPRRA